jgi:hypothetical protein
MQSKWSLRAGAVTLAMAATTVASANAAPLAPPQVLMTATMEMSLVAAGDRDGNAVVVLRPGPGAPVLFQRPAAGSWTGAGPLPGSGQRLSLQVAAAGSGAAATVWRADYSAIQAIVRTAGGTFGAPLTVAGPSAGGVRHPAVGVDAHGGAVVAYQAGIGLGSRRQREARIEVALHSPGASGFGRPAVLARGTAGAPAVAVNEDGDAVVAWRHGTRVEAASITGRSVGKTRVLGRAYGGWNPSVAIGRTGDAAVAWSSRRTQSLLPVEQFVAASLRRGRHRFGRPDVLARDEAARYVHAAVGDDGRAMVVWPGQPPAGAVKAAIARPGARNFGAPLAVSPSPPPFDLDFAAAPTGFVVLWPVASPLAESGWRLALAGPGAPLRDAGQVSDPFLEGYRIDSKNAAVFGDRLGRVTAVWVQPPAVPPPVPGPTPQTPVWTLQAAEGVVLPSARG